MTIEEKIKWLTVHAQGTVHIHINEYQLIHKNIDAWARAVNRKEWVRPTGITPEELAQMHAANLTVGVVVSSRHFGDDIEVYGGDLGDTLDRAIDIAFDLLDMNLRS